MPRVATTVFGYQSWRLESEMEHHDDELAAPTPFDSKDPQTTRRAVIWIAGAVALVCTTAVATMLALTYGAREEGTQEQPLVAVSDSSVPEISRQGAEVERKLLQNESLADGDVAGITADELRRLRNTIFARYGRAYGRPGLGVYFDSRPWYRANPLYDDSLLSTLDKQNIEVFLRAEAQEPAQATASTIARDEASDVATSNSASSGYLGQDLATPAAAYNSLSRAFLARDRAAYKQCLSTATVETLRASAARKNISLDSLLDKLMAPAGSKIARILDVRVVGEKAVVIAEQDRDAYGRTHYPNPFVLENGQWKLAIGDVTLTYKLVTGAVALDNYSAWLKYKGR